MKKLLTVLVLLLALAVPDSLVLAQSSVSTQVAIDITAPAQGITVNGLSSGASVTTPGSMTVAVANGPGLVNDWMGVFTSPTPSAAALVSWNYLNCTQTAPTTGLKSASCTMTVPSAAGSYWTFFLANQGTYSTVYANAPFTVTSGIGPTISSLTFSATCGGTPFTSLNSVQIAVNAGANALLGYACPTMSDGSTFNGTMAVMSQTDAGLMEICSSSACTTNSTAIPRLSGPLYLTTARNVTSADVGAQNAVIKLTPGTGEGGSPVTATLYMNVATTVASACSATGGTYNGAVPSPVPCPNGIPAPPGYHWNLTLDDEFTHDTSLNTSMWCQVYAPGGAGQCSPGFAGISFDPVNGLSIQPANSSAAGLRTGIESYTAFDAPSGGVTFFQRYGVREWSAKLPSDANGEGTGYHPDIWMRAYNPSDSASLGFTINEDDINEAFPVTPGVPSTGHNINADNTAQTNVGCNNGCPSYPPSGFLTGGQNLGNSFHTYADYWKNDGSAYGSEQVYLDGVPQNSPYTFQSDYWDNGVITIMTMDGCPPGGSIGGYTCSSNLSNNNPFQIRYIRIWQLVAG